MSSFPITLGSLVVGPIQFGQPIMLVLIAVLGVLSVLIARKSLAGLGRSSRIAALVIRILAIALIVGALARPELRKTTDAVGVTVIVDASRSIPVASQAMIDQYIAQAQNDSRKGEDLLGVITAAEGAYIQSTPSKHTRTIDRQFIGGTDGTNLAEALNLAIATAPKNAANRFVLVSDGNETDGSILRAAQAAKAVGLPIDVLPVEFDYSEEVIVDSLQTPSNVRVGDTISVKVILTAVRPAAGRLMLSQDGTAIDLNPDENELGEIIELHEGRNVVVVPVPVRRPGPQLYEAVFEPLAVLDDNGSPGQTIGDSIRENNIATAITFVGDEGVVLIVAEDPAEAVVIEDALHQAEIQTEVINASQFASNLPGLVSYEAIILINESAFSFSDTQQEIMRQYVHETGGGLIMIGGPESFGAGGWIGSPLADALPIRLDPPQKRQMPRGALAMVVHSVEIPRGVFYGKEICNAAVDALSRLDLVGIVEYQGLGGTDWVYPVSPVGDRTAVKQAIQDLQFGDMPSFDPSLQLALQGLKNASAGQKHCIVISDGDPSLSRSLLRDFKQAGITISAVGVNPHSPGDTNTLRTMARVTGGTFYNVSNNALATLPQIFVKEAQTIRRALIWEGEAFSPAMTGVPTVTMRGINGVPPIEGYVVAAEREGLALVTLRGKEDDPVAAQWEYGLGKVVTFTSDVSSRWAPAWVSWDGFNQFWEQHVRWAMRPGGNATLRVNTEQVGERTRVIVEAFDPDGNRLDFANFRARVATPDGSGQLVEVRQVGPGRYEGDFSSADAGSYVINMQYRAPGKEGAIYEGSAQAAVTRPFADEFRSLKTNTPLLQQVAAMTGGVMLPADANASNLWRRDGLTPPVALTPVWLAFALIGIAIFLLDVAVRRVRISPAAILASIRRSAGREQDKSTGAADAMRLARTKARSRTGNEDDANRKSRKFEAAEGSASANAPIALKGETESESPLAKPKRTIEKDEKPVDALSALRAAKQRAKDDMKDL